jgi:ABC-type glutathione transport system ATPase component
MPPPLPARARQAVSAREVSVIYDGVAVLDRVSVELVPGQEPLGVIGASGAGKTSLVRVLAGWQPVSQGTVAFGDLDVYNPPRRQRKYVTAAVRGVHEEQNPVEAQQATGDRMLSKALKLASKTGRGPVMMTEDLCGLVGFDPAKLGRILRTTSLGEQQRLAMAVALATDPDVLILDEPATALHPEATLTVVDAVVSHAVGRGAAVLVVSHDLELIGHLTSTVMVLVDGREVARGPLRTVLANPADPYLQELAAIHATEAATRRPEPTAQAIRQLKGQRAAGVALR